MFKVEGHAAYEWHHVFLVLAWAGFEQYLAELKFPLPDDIQRIRPIAESFTEQFHSFIWHIYRGQQLSPDAQQLFDETYRWLVSEIGQEKAEIFCEWGNQFDIPNSTINNFDRTLRIVTEMGRKQKLTSLSIEQQKYLQNLSENFRERSKELGNTLDTLDEALKEDEKGKIVLMRYNFPQSDEHTSEHLILSPTDCISEWINYFRERTLLATLKATLSKAELQAVNAAVRTHPDWVKLNESPNRQTPLIDLLQLLDQL